MSRVVGRQVVRGSGEEGRPPPARRTPRAGRRRPRPAGEATGGVPRPPARAQWRSSTDTPRPGCRLGLPRSPAFHTVRPRLVLYGVQGRTAAWSEHVWRCTARAVGRRQKRRPGQRPPPRQLAPATKPSFANGDATSVHAVGCKPGAATSPPPPAAPPPGAQHADIDSSAAAAPAHPHTA